MTPEQKAAFIFAQAVAALARLEAMKALNQYRERRNENQAYDEEAFNNVELKYGISHNAILNLFYS